MDETKDAGRTFGVDLWDGFPKVHSHVHDGRSEMKRLQTFFSERAFAEAQYAKNLQKCCENLLAEKFTFGGTTGAAVMKLEKCNRQAITKHSELARRMNTHADKTLKSLIENLKKKCNEMKKTHDKVSDQVASKDSQMKKAQRNYNSNNENCINQVSNRNTLMANNAPQPKLDKAEKKLKSVANKLANSEKSYKEAVDNLRKQQIDRDGNERKLLTQAEGLARNRMAEVQTALGLWKDIFDDMSRHNSDLASQLDAAVNSIDVNNDIQEFIAKSYSGQDINKSHVVYQPLEKIDMSCFADRFKKGSATTPSSAHTPVTPGGPAISGPMNTGGGVGSKTASTPLSTANTSGGRSDSSASHSGGMEQKSSLAPNGGPPVGGGMGRAPPPRSSSPAGSPLSGPAGPNGGPTIGGPPMGRGGPMGRGAPKGRGGPPTGRGGPMANNSHAPRPPSGGPAMTSGGPAPVASGGPQPSGNASPPKVSAPGPPVSEERKYVRALYDTTVEEEAQPGVSAEDMQPNELRFVAGDIILFREDLGNGWWRGELRDGNEGIMPANYVEIIESPNIPSPSWDDIMRIAQRFCKAIFAFQGNRDDGELSFDIGDEIEIISEIEEWYNGRTKDGQTGLFPQTYVEP